MYFTPESGKIYCKNCMPVGERYNLSASVVQAMRYVTLSDFDKIFSFSLSEESMDIFCQVCEGYLLHKTQRKFKTLEFYKTLTEL
jgi:DNA repair protein RecO (recombination protein O)